MRRPPWPGVRSEGSPASGPALNLAQRPGQSKELTRTLAACAIFHDPDRPLRPPHPAGPLDTRPLDTPAASSRHQRHCGRPVSSLGQKVPGCRPGQQASVPSPAPVSPLPGSCDKRWITVQVLTLLLALSVALNVASAAGINRPPRRRQRGPGHHAGGSCRRQPSWPSSSPPSPPTAD